MELLWVLLATGVASGVLLWVRHRRRRSAPPAFVSADRIHQQRDIIALLQQVVEQRATLRVRLRGRGASFTSLLLTLDDTTMLIDSLFPDEGNQLIDEAQSIDLEFIIRGVASTPFRCSAPFHEHCRHESYAALRLGLPELIVRNQKRNFHRVSPPVNAPVFLNCTINNQRHRFPVANISGGGIGFFTNLSQSVLFPGQMLIAASVSLPEAVDIPGTAVIHAFRQPSYPVLIDGEPFHYYCGAEFITIDAPAREAIIRYVVDQERRTLQRLHRHE